MLLQQRRGRRDDVPGQQVTEHLRERPPCEVHADPRAMDADMAERIGVMLDVQGLHQRIELAMRADGEQRIDPTLLGGRHDATRWLALGDTWRMKSSTAASS